MKAAFPYMGNIYIPLRILFKNLGITPIIPPPYNRETLTIGARYAPELMCIPFKLTLGNLIKSLEMGADTIIHTSGWWSCRYGYYPHLAHLILNELGFKFRPIVLRRDRLWEIFAILKEIHRDYTEIIRRLIRAFTYGYYKSRVLEKLERLAFLLRPREKNYGEVSRWLRYYLAILDKAEGIKEMRDLYRVAKEEILSRVNKEEVTRIRVKIVGESFCVLEPFVNFNILERLGEMGIEVDPTLTAHRWLGFHSIGLGKKEVKKILPLAEVYWRWCVGGEDKNTIGYSIKAARDNYDGIIHLQPFACMPQTCAQSALEKVALDYHIPILQLSLDEFTQEGSFYNRVEAFVELMKRRKIRRLGR